MTQKTAWEKVKDWWKNLKPPVKGGIIGFIVGYFFLGFALLVVFLMTGRVSELGSFLWEMLLNLYVMPSELGAYVVNRKVGRGYPNRSKLRGMYPERINLFFAIPGAIIGVIVSSNNCLRKKSFPRYDCPD